MLPHIKIIQKIETFPGSDTKYEAIVKDYI